MSNFTKSNGKTLRHTRADVLAAAMKILDELGLPDLTMRRLAATLEVQPSALYWHFANKQTLLACIADEIIDRAQGIGVGLDWKAATRAEAESLRNALLAFRDGAEVVSSTLALGLGANQAQARLTKALTGGGFDAATAETAAAAILHLILGQVWHEQQRIQADSLGVVSGTAAVTPEHAALGLPSNQAFELGIALLLEGLEQLAHSRNNLGTV
ncbi:TetR family transcriptional regulator [Rhodoluna limnophila]|uniref:TetR family transcriptional regulator n=1 Tax=Rhodoluna limnophila TaxID=232537 RepID=UPI0015625516|nr:TetR/AcrR family transcriptional regulator C-terminal domain-containing protein [Rhodoluna limnophila]